MSSSCSFTPWETAPSTHWTEDFVGPRVGLDAVEKRKILQCRESNSAVQPVAGSYWYYFDYREGMRNILSAILASRVKCSKRTNGRAQVNALSMLVTRHVKYPQHISDKALDNIVLSKAVLSWLLNSVASVETVSSSISD